MKNHVVPLKPVTERYVRIKLDIETYQKLQFIASLLGRPMNGLLVTAATNIAKKCPDRTAFASFAA